MGTHDDNIYGTMMKDQSLTLHVEEGVKKSVLQASEGLINFLKGGLDGKLPLLDGALGPTDEGEDVVKELTKRRELLVAEMTSQKNSASDIDKVMQMSLGIIEHADKNS